MNKLIWNLNELFKDNQAFYKEIINVYNLTKSLEINYKDIELNPNSLLELLEKEWLIKEKSNNILIYGSLMYYKDINNEECIKLKKEAEKTNNEINTSLKFIDRKILDLGLDNINNFINKQQKLEIYKHSLYNLFRLNEHITNDEINKKIQENNNTINEELTKYNKLLKDITYGYIEINNEKIELNSSNIIKYLSSENREIRKQTYFNVNKSFKKYENNFASILNLIYKKRIENSNLEKYNSVLEKVLFEENINPLIIEKLINIVNNKTYLIQSYLDIKFNLFKIKDPHLYDFNIKLNNNLKTYSLEEAKEIILKALKPLGKEYIKVVKILLNGHIDAELNENKHQSITFSWNTYSFLNFKGSYVDLKNLIHEIGHIVNYYLSSKKQPFIYEDSTIFVGEIASIVNEILLNRYLYNNANNNEEKILYLSKEIENYFTSIFKQVMYTEYENKIYSLSNKQDLTPDILSENYINIIKKYYGNNIIYDNITNIEWTRLGHLYRWSYYPYKYATGLLLASLVVDSLIDKKTLSKEDYINFLSKGSSNYSLELLKILNIDLINTNIIENGFNVLSNDIDKLKKLLLK